MNTQCVMFLRSLMPLKFVSRAQARGLIQVKYDLYFASHLGFENDMIYICTHYLIGNLINIY